MSKTKTTKVEAEPWDPAQAALKNVIAASDDMYAKGGYQVNPYEGNRVAGQSSDTLSALASMGRPSQVTASTQQAYNRMLGPETNQPNFDAFTGVDPNQPNFSEFRGVDPNQPNFDAFTGPDANRPRFDQYTGVDANRPGFSDFTNDARRNAAFDQMKASTIADTKASLGSTLAGGGLNTGLGAEMFGRGMGEAIGGIEYSAYGDAQNRKLQAQGMESDAYGRARAMGLQASGMESDAYARDRAMGLQATGMNADMYNTGLNRRLQAAGMDADMYNTGLNRRLQAAGMNADQYNSAKQRQMNLLGMAGAMQGMGFRDQDRQLQAGRLKDQQAQNLINAQMAQYYEQQNAPIDALSKYGNMSAMMGGMGGTTSGSETAPWSIDDVGKVGKAIMGSDRRLKDNINKIGVTEGGNNVYSYTYKGGKVLHKGPMADEVPWAVVGTINGYSIVDYGKVK